MLNQLVPCINISVGNETRVILCVYMKYISGGEDHHNEIFQWQLEELKLIINDLHTVYVTIRV